MTEVDVVGDHAEMLVGDQGAHLGLLVERVADADVLRALHDPCGELVGNVGVHQQPGAGVAALALVEVGAEDDLLQRGVEVGVGEDDLRVLAAQLEADLLEILGGCQGDHPADSGGAGEGGHLGAGMTRQPGAHVPAAVNQVHGSGRQSFFVQELHEPGGCAGCEVARLHHGGAADGQGERQFLGDDQQREVPWGDHPDDADRLFDGDGEVVGAETVVCVSVGVLGEGGGVVPDRGGTGHLVPGLRDRLAGLQRLDQGKVVSFGFDPGRDATQEGCSFGAGGLRPVPDRECAVGGDDSGVDVGLARAVIAGDADVVRRAVAEHLVAGASGLMAVDDVRPGVGADGGRVGAGGDGHGMASGLGAVGAGSGGIHVPL